MPGPMADCARSTGAMFSRIMTERASGSSRRSAFWKSRREAMDESSGRGRQTITTDEARALAPEAIGRLLSSVLIGQVPVI